MKCIASEVKGRKARTQGQQHRQYLDYIGKQVLSQLPIHDFTLDKVLANVLVVEVITELQEQFRRADVDLAVEKVGADVDGVVVEDDFFGQSDFIFRNVVVK